MIPRCTSRLSQALRPKFHNPSLRLRGSASRRRAYWRQPLHPSAAAQTRSYTLPASAALAAVVAGYYIIQHRSPRRLDARPSIQGDALTSGAKVQITGQDHGDNVEKVETGTSTVPQFPKSIWLPHSGRVDDGKTPALPAGLGMAQEEEEYQLLGLGVRKVSLFRIEVYVVGLYVAKGDVARLQEQLVKTYIGSGASTLVGNEKTELRKQLLDGKGSERIWDEVLKAGGVKTAIRIVPVKNTNFGHMRDGWIRAIDARGKGPGYDDEAFKRSVSELKVMMGGKGSVATGRTMLLNRGIDGSMRAWVEGDAAVKVEETPRLLIGKGERMNLLGRVEDERVSRLVWLNYVAGDSPASEQARESIVDGVIDLVERPIGTVETQVV